MTVLFPQLMREFNVDTATVQWITTIYLLAVAATMPLSSFIKRRFRNKTIFVAAVVLAVLGSLIMIVAQGVPADPRRARDPGRRFGHGHAADDEHHPWNSRPRSKVGRLMGVGSLVIHRGAGHRPDRRRCGDQRSAVAGDLRHRDPLSFLLISLPVGLKCIQQKHPTEAAVLNPLQFVSIVLTLCGLITCSSTRPAWRSARPSAAAR